MNLRGRFATLGIIALVRGDNFVFCFLYSLFFLSSFFLDKRVAARATNISRRQKIALASFICVPSYQRYVPRYDGRTVVIFIHSFRYCRFTIQFDAEGAPPRVELGSFLVGNLFGNLPSSSVPGEPETIFGAEMRAPFPSARSIPAQSFFGPSG